MISSWTVPKLIPANRQKASWSPSNKKQWLAKSTEMKITSLEKNSHLIIYLPDHTPGGRREKGEGGNIPQNSVFSGYLTGSSCWWHVLTGTRIFFSFLQEKTIYLTAWASSSFSGCSVGGQIFQKHIFQMRNEFVPFHNEQLPNNFTR